MFRKYENEINQLNSTFNKREIPDIYKSGKYVIYQNRKLLNLSSNDYLGIAENQQISKDFLKNCNYSFGSASSRLLTGTSNTYKELEQLISKLYKKDSALLFNSGYHANVGIISSLVNKNDVVFSDKLNHASIIDGMRLSDGSFYRYKHLDYEHLESLLEQHRNKFENAIIIIESIFSMDGDSAVLKRLIDLKRKYNAILIVDEAHAFGVFGENGLGLAEEQSCLEEIDLVVATFGKSIGSMGAFCCGNRILIDYLTNKARSFIFSTALPEINIAFSKFIVESILPNTKSDRYNLLKTAQQLREMIKEATLTTVGDSHIVPIIIGSNEDTVKDCKVLQDNGFYTLPIRHPAVAMNSARIRLSLRTDIKIDEISQIPRILNKAKSELYK